MLDNFAKWRFTQVKHTWWAWWDTVDADPLPPFPSFYFIFFRPFNASFWIPFPFPISHMLLQASTVMKSTSFFVVCSE
jgi:hypothetical protein